MSTRILATATILTVAIGSASAADWVRVEPQVGFPSLGGHVAYSASGVSGTTADVADLGLDGRKSTPGIEVDISPPLLPIGFNVGGYRYSNTGSERLSQTIDFGGKSFTAGSDIDSKLDLEDLYAEVNFQPIHWGLGGASLGLALHRLDVKASLATTGVSADFDKSLYYPSLAVRAYVSPIDSIQIEAAVQIFRLNIGGRQVGYTDAKAQVGWFPLPVHYLGLFAGYRYINYDLAIDHANIEATLSLSGPFVGLEARF